MGIGKISAQSEAVGITAWIEAKASSSSGKTEVRAIIDNDSDYDIDLQYELNMVKVSDTGTSKFRKSGIAAISPKKNKIVASTVFYTKKNQNFVAVFKLFNEVGIIFTDSLVFPQKKTNSATIVITPPIEKTNSDKIVQQERNQKQPNSSPKNKINNAPVGSKIRDTKNQSNSPEAQNSGTLITTPNTETTEVATSSKKKITNIAVDVLEIDGLIIDETRAKIARDFYDLFYKKWIAPPNAKDFSIYIKEQPARGRGVQVLIAVNDQDIFQHFIPARYDDMEEVVNLAIRTARAYLMRRGSIADQLQEEDQMGNGIY